MCLRAVVPGVVTMWKTVRGASGLPDYGSSNARTELCLASAGTDVRPPDELLPSSQATSQENQDPRPNIRECQVQIGAPRQLQSPLNPAAVSPAKHDLFRVLSNYHCLPWCLVCLAQPRYVYRTLLESTDRVKGPFLPLFSPRSSRQRVATHVYGWHSR